MTRRRQRGQVRGAPRAISEALAGHRSQPAQLGGLIRVGGDAERGLGQLPGAGVVPGRERSAHVRHHGAGRGDGARGEKS
ncbi:MAG: hypothetical protein IPG81_23980 [Sandaracinaceae bacterium]|nr:hypothetical protein [Sandaracinaceae bacterium]